MNSVLAIGLMSGTSMDGVDAALIETDGEDMVRPLAFVSQPYADTERDVLRAAMARALSLDAPAVHPDIAAASALVDRRHIEAVRALLAKSGHSAEEIEVVGYHGQAGSPRPRTEERG